MQLDLMPGQQGFTLLWGCPFSQSPTQHIPLRTLQTRPKTIFPVGWVNMPHYCQSL